MTKAHLTAAPDPGPIDFRHLDATLANLDRAARVLGTVAADLAAARDRAAATPDDPEARRRGHMASLRMRGEAAAVAVQLASLAQPDGAAP